MGRNLPLVSPGVIRTRRCSTWVHRLARLKPVQEQCLQNAIQTCKLRQREASEAPAARQEPSGARWWNAWRSSAFLTAFPVQHTRTHSLPPSQSNSLLEAVKKKPKFLGRVKTKWESQRPREWERCLELDENPEWYRPRRVKVWITCNPAPPTPVCWFPWNCPPDHFLSLYGSSSTPSLEAHLPSLCLRWLPSSLFIFKCVCVCVIVQHNQKEQSRRGKERNSTDITVHLWSHQPCVLGTLLFTLPFSQNEDASCHFTGLLRDTWHTVSS